MTSSSLILFSSAIFLADGEDLAGEDFVSTLTAFTSSFIFSSLFLVFLGVGFLPFDSSKIPFVEIPAQDLIILLIESSVAIFIIVSWLLKCLSKEPAAGDAAGLLPT